MAYFQFTSPGLSDSMNAALTWLIERGGAQSPQSVVVGGTNRGHRYAVKVTRGTIGALVQRGMLAQGRGGRLQVTAKAVGHLVDYPQNPHPEYVMAAAAWDEAHSHAEWRHQRGIDTPAARTGPSDQAVAALADVAAVRRHTLAMCRSLPGSWPPAEMAARLDRIEAALRAGGAA